MPRGRPKEFDRAEALERALEVFWAHGFDDAGLAELTAAMGIGRQSLYDTFGDKRALYMEALGHYCDRQTHMLEAMLLGEGESASMSPGQRLRGFLDAWAPLFGGEMQRGCMAMNAAVSCSPERDSDLLELVQAHSDRMDAAVVGTIREAIATGEIRSDVPAETMAATVLAAAHGLSAVAATRDVQSDAAAVVAGLAGLMGLDPRPQSNPPANPPATPPAGHGDEPLATTPTAAPPAWRDRTDSWKQPARRG